MTPNEWQNVVNQTRVPIIPPNATCQEASPMSRSEYVPCAHPAEAVVFHQKDNKYYFMCGPCADHNVRNRGYCAKSALIALLVAFGTFAVVFRQVSKSVAVNHKTKVQGGCPWP